MTSRAACLTMLLAAGLMAFPAVAGPVRTGATDDGRPVIENDLYRLEFDLARGGRCTSFRLKTTGRELIYTHNQNGGLFMVHWAKYQWPSEFHTTPFTHSFEEGEAGAKRIRLSCVVSGKGPKYEDSALRGLVLEKTITLYPDRRSVDVEMALLNPTDRARGAAFWVQNAFYLGNTREWDTYYRPSSRGIWEMGYLDPYPEKWGKDWVKDPVAGWTAALDAKTNEAVVFLIDYNYLDILYNNGLTVEWFLEQGLSPAGGRWATTYSMVPVDGFAGFTHASARLIADIALERSPDSMTITHTTAATEAAIGKLELVATVVGVRSGKTLGTASVTLKNIGGEPVRTTVTVDAEAEEPVVVRVKAVGEGWVEAYESVFPDRAGIRLTSMHENVLVPEYQRQGPAKVKTYHKPDLTELVATRQADDKTDVLVFFGLWTQWYHFDRILSGLGKHRLVLSNAPASGAEYCPGSYDELFGFDTVILSDVCAGALKHYGIEMVTDFVAHGGGVLLTGGAYAYGAGTWQATKIAPLLPLTVTEAFDMTWHKAGLPVRPAERVQHPILAGVDHYHTRPAVYWLHEVAPKADGEVLMHAGDRPLLVVGRYGKGKVACWLGAPCGETVQGQTAFWDWPGWDRLMANTIRWLADWDTVRSATEAD